MYLAIYKLQNIHFSFKKMNLTKSDEFVSLKRGSSKTRFQQVYRGLKNE